MAEVEAHFRQHYLAAEIKCAPTLEANGAAMRTSGDRSLIASIRETIEKERAKVQTALNLRDGEKVVVGTATIRNRALVIVLTVKLIK